MQAGEWRAGVPQWRATSQRPAQRATCTQAAGHHPGGNRNTALHTQNTVTVTARAHSANHRGARTSHGREPNKHKKAWHASLEIVMRSHERERRRRAGTWRRRENHAGHVHLRAVISAGRGCAARCLRRDRRGGGALVEGVRVPVHVRGLESVLLPASARLIGTHPSPDPPCTCTHTLTQICHPPQRRSP